MILLAILLASTPQPTPDPRPVLIVDTPYQRTTTGPRWRLKVHLYPKLSEVYQGADIPTLYGPILFEVRRPHHEPRFTPLEALEDGGTFGATLYPFKPFIPTFQDLNHDGHPDFSLCERVGAYYSKCRIFTVEADGSVSLLGALNIYVDLEPTLKLLEVTPDGFCYPAAVDENRRHCSRWNSGTRKFEPVLQATPSANPAQ